MVAVVAVAHTSVGTVLGRSEVAALAAARWTEKMAGQVLLCARRLV